MGTRCGGNPRAPRRRHLAISLLWNIADFLTPPIFLSAALWTDWRDVVFWLSWHPRSGAYLDGTLHVLAGAPPQTINPFFNEGATLRGSSRRRQRGVRGGAYLGPQLVQELTLVHLARSQVLHFILYDQSCRGGDRGRRSRGRRLVRGSTLQARLRVDRRLRRRRRRRLGNTRYLVREAVGFLLLAVVRRPDFELGLRSGIPRRALLHHVGQLMRQQLASDGLPGAYCPAPKTTLWPTV
jgi:hypothetical protein